jgi:CBS domain-containing protein
MKIHEILRQKGEDVVTIAEDHSVLEAVRTLVDHNIGALVVMKGDRPIGIITERDILRFSAAVPAQLETVTVHSLMSRDLVVAEPGDELREMMDVMTERRIRHLPVLDGDRLVGIISIGDLLNACRTLAENENAQLRQYIHGAA